MFSRSKIYPNGFVKVLISCRTHDEKQKKTMKRKEKMGQHSIHYTHTNGEEEKKGKQILDRLMIRNCARAVSTVSSVALKFDSLGTMKNAPSLLCLVA